MSTHTCMLPPQNFVFEFSVFEKKHSTVLQVDNTSQLFQHDTSCL